MINEYVIEGLFLTQRITGIQRYAYEITMELDNQVQKDELQILVPASIKELPKLNNIRIVKYGKNNGIKWQQIDVPKYLRKNKKKGIFLTNILPLVYAKGIIAIHDVSYKANPQFFTSKRDRVSALWHRLNYWRAAHSNMNIVTVSEFSKSEIMKYYHVSPDRITVVYNAWQHMDRIAYAENTFEKYPYLRKDEYYFSMSTLAPNKNFKWILEAAKQNPNEKFAIAGGGKLREAADESGYKNLDNVFFLGYVSDEDAKTLMANCKAFLFPTLYEGFGIPPLEAIACGAKQVLVSDTPCMHEVYGDDVNYIDARQVNGKSLGNCKSVKKDILEKYSWRKSSEEVWKRLKK